VFDETARMTLLGELQQRGTLDFSIVAFDGLMEEFV
jgi:hypothetical protein